MGDAVDLTRLLVDDVVVDDITVEKVAGSKDRAGVEEARSCDVRCAPVSTRYVSNGVMELLPRRSADATHQLPADQVVASDEWLINPIRLVSPAADDQRFGHEAGQQFLNGGELPSRPLGIQRVAQVAESSPCRARQSSYRARLEARRPVIEGNGWFCIKVFLTVAVSDGRRFTARIACEDTLSCRYDRQLVSFVKENLPLE